MARDYLAIQGSSTAAEREFSSGTLTGTKLCNRLSAKFFEVLQLLKSGYRNGHISAGESAANCMEALITELHEQGYGLEGLEADDEDENGEDEYMTDF
jgi:hypothetical protein